MSLKSVLMPLVGFLYNGQLSVEGQLLTFKSGLLDLTKKPEGFRRHVSRLWKLYRHNHVTGRQLYVALEKQHFTIDLDENGFFRFETPIDKNYSNYDLDHLLKFYKDEKHTEEITVPAITLSSIYNVGHPKYIVISDVDDTILITHATSFLKRVPQTIVRHAFKRKEVEDMSKFYKELKKQGAEIFYVSNSEMNLFWIIKLFLITRKFPLGPIYLRYQKNWKDFIRSPKANNDQLKNVHKVSRIAYLINKFPDQKFLLVGDSGQKDPYTYQSIAQEFSNNISGIMIRDVNKGKKDEEMKEIEKSLKEIGVPFFLFHDPKEAMRQERRWYQSRVLRH
ncbi:DUF2183 domain-containing protein [Flammeovirga yaeyamensis]|uniref:DUF2183 domain-containing protein n=1 Tax=Flammeovirga yaeyamensis TaxID=367791 RepID=A0AAX1MYB3_9BACT|nr:phosphatase domain-containing protein [Flammeovirga yaeyamensis]MBB3696176.1 phosphatidate phosphatase APP1 [Flammeovirga yaeyamensis]NMF34859.1 DUF2183 domain-containing protein [Flammeovirga yaeyamensis]QWG00314.1 DUF2183 domain-containing protein [Flammeovirga yaeyamensis]